MSRPAAILIALLSAAAAVASPASAVARAADTVIAKAGGKGTIAVSVVDVSSGETWVSRAADTPLKPASVLKLFTTAAALERLGSRFEFRTTFLYSNGELWVIGGGDPGFGDPRLLERRGMDLEKLYDQLSERVRAAVGSGEIRAIVLDDGVFDQQWRNPTWPADQADAWYQAPSGGLNVNDNCVDAQVKVEGGKASVLTTPLLPTEFVLSTVKVDKKHAPSARRSFDSDRFEFTGTVSKSDSLSPVCVRRPTLFFGYSLREALRKRGIRVADAVMRREIRSEDAVAAGRLAVEATSMRDAVWRTNRFSQNFFADCLLKSLAAYERDGRRAATPGGWEAGARAAREALARIGVNLSGAHLVDGSGLSHDNRVTAAQITELLRGMPRHREWATFEASLARPGEDGTLRRRFGDSPLKDRISAKTGSISGVRTLAGYVERPDGVTLAFAVMCSGAPDLTTAIAECLLASD